MSYQIDRVFSVKLDKILSTNQVLSYDEETLFKLRRDLKGEKKGILLCAECFQPLILAGSVHQVLHFKHYPGSEDCPIKSTCQLTQEEVLAIKFNGQKEGAKHKRNKEFIAHTLRADPAFYNVQVESTFREENTTGVAKRWRRPDINVVKEPEGLRIAIELQVSTTFIDVIIEREKFYKENNAAILWVFLDFDNSKFTQKDIFYSSNLNAFVLDDEARRKSEEEGRLFLTCYYHDYSLHEEGYRVTVNEEMKQELVAISQLYWDRNIGKILYQDVKSKREQIAIQKTNRQLQLDEIKTRHQQHVSGNAPRGRQHSKRRESKSLEENVGSAIGSITRRRAKDKLKCPKCSTRTDFRSSGPFIYCKRCNVQIEY